MPALLAHPDWETPRPVVIWMHGRTVNKELDSGRYLRWLKAEGGGIAACAIDLPGHGDRFDRKFHHPENTLQLLETALGEVDHVYEALGDPKWKGVFDLDRVAIGGMSAGGMVTLRRLCDDHPFVGAAVEGTTGWLEGLYGPNGATPWPVQHDQTKVDTMDAMRRLSAWRAIPVLALHAELDQIVPLRLQERFIESLRAHYRDIGADPEMVRMVTWPQTGAPQEHSGFGKFGNEAKNEQTTFLTRLFGLTG